MDNREIDKLVAEKVMGWQIHPRNTAHWIDKKDIDNISYRPMAWVDEWMPTKKIGRAWQVVEKLIEMGFYPVIWVKPGIVQIYDHDEKCIIEEKAAIPLAICLAALRAVGVEVAP